MFRFLSFVGGPLSLALLLLFPAKTAGQKGLLPGADSAEESEAGESELELLQQELTALQARTEHWRTLAKENREAWEQAPIQLREIEEEIARLSDRSTIEVALDSTMPQLEAELAVAHQKQAAAHQDATEVDAEATRRMKRRRQIPELLAQAREQLRELDAVSESLSSTELTEVANKVAEQRRLALQAELEAYEYELANYDARSALLAKRRDHAAAGLAYYGTLVGKLRKAIKDNQRRALTEQNAEAERLLTGVEGLPREVRKVARDIADQNAALAELWVGEKGLIEKMNTVTSRLDRARSKVSAVEADLSVLAAKVEAVGLADSVGTLLRRQRAEVPDVGMYRRFVQMRKEQIGAAQLQQIRLQEKREELTDIDARVQETMDSLEQDLHATQRAEAERILRTLYDHQRQYMDALVVDYETYFQRLVDFDAEQRTLIERSEALIEFIDEHVLWMPSGSPLGPNLIIDIKHAVQWLSVPRYWRQVQMAVYKVSSEQVTATVLVIAFVVLMLVLRPRVRRRLRTLSQRVGPGRDSDSGIANLEALGLTCLNALWLPLILLLTGETVGNSPDATLFVRSIAHGVVVSALYWGMLLLISEALTKHGLAEVYAGWNARALSRMSWHLRWLIWTTVPLVFLVFVFEGRGEDVARESLGRSAFIMALLPVTVFCFLLTRSQGAFAEILRCRWAPRSRAWMLRLIQLFAVAGPVALGSAAVLGYYWTSLQFSMRYHLMVVFLFLLLLSLDMMRMWTLRAERRLALEAKRRKDELEAKTKAESDSLAEGRVSTEIATPPSEEEVDLSVVTRQTGRLTIVFALVVGLLGLSAIWADLFPAAGILREVELWQVARDVTTTSVDASGVEHSVEQRVLSPITLADLAVALLIASLSWLLLRNLPGLFEVTLFQRLQAGERYAYATIVKYIIAVTGATLAFDAIGIGWSSIQWLLAAVGLGLGFGLQEIFANFVSGLIILLERPIRVGDIVTVDGVSGKVTRIRIRATWITAFDRKELVVPNKEFVTSRLVNWSLSDSILRVEVPVGIAYGSNVQKAIEILHKLAAKNELILSEPPPQVLFLTFGDNALGLELRAFVGDPDNRIPTIHQLHMAINHAYAEAGIEIAFPQMDLHLRDVPPNILESGAQNQEAKDA